MAKKEKKEKRLAGKYVFLYQVALIDTCLNVGMSLMIDWQRSTFLQNKKNEISYTAFLFQ